MASIDDLSDITLCKILSYIDINERQRLGMVCKRWKSLIERIWKTINKLFIDFGELIPVPVEEYSDIPDESHFTIDLLKLPVLRTVLTLCGPELTKLTIYHRDSYGEESTDTFEPLQQCKNLKIFDVFTYDNVLIHDCLENLPIEGLEELSITNVEDAFDDELNEVFEDTLKKAESLISLRLSSVTSPLLEIIGKMSGLKVLDLGDRSDLPTLNGSSLDTTELVNLEKNIICEGRMVNDKFLIELAKNCRKLHSIKLWSDDLIHDGLNALETLPNLRCVNLSLPRQVEILNYFSNLEKFYCDLNRRKSVTEESLTKFFLRSPNLRVCYFDNDSLHQLFGTIAAKVGAKIEFKDC